MDVRQPKDWLYRASAAQENFASTQEFVKEFGFISRSVYVDGDRDQMIPLVAKVGFRDLIHVYYVEKGTGKPLGTFRVVGPNNHPNPEQFAAAIKGAPTLRVVAEGKLLDHLIKAEGYARDPKLGVYCGWPVVPDDSPSPSYTPRLFPGRSSLVEYTGVTRRR